MWKEGAPCPLHFCLQMVVFLVFWFNNTTIDAMLGGVRVGEDLACCALPRGSYYHWMYLTSPSNSRATHTYRSPVRAGMVRV